MSSELTQATTITAATKDQLLVSCQPAPPLDAPSWIALVCQAVLESGAAGVRVNGEENIAAVRAVTTKPIIGIKKIRSPESSVYITPTREAVSGVLEAGCDIVALDGSPAARADGSSLEELISLIHQAGKLAMADISTAEEARHALDSGADFVGTTLSGYTPGSPQREEPDLQLVEKLARWNEAPVIAEGRYNNPGLFREALSRGAHAVVVGKAITEPRFIVEAFLATVEG